MCRCAVCGEWIFGKIMELQHPIPIPESMYLHSLGRSTETIRILWKKYTVHERHVDDLKKILERLDDVGELEMSDKVKLVMPKNMIQAISGAISLAREADGVILDEKLYLSLKKLEEDFNTLVETAGVDTNVFLQRYKR